MGCHGGIPKSKSNPTIPSPTKGFRVEAIWGLTHEDAETVAKELHIPYATKQIDDVLLRKVGSIMCTIIINR